MNINRLALSVTLLLSTASMSVHTAGKPCPHGCKHDHAPAASVDELLQKAKKQFNLTDAEVVQLRVYLENNIDADIAAIVSQLRAL